MLYLEQRISLSRHQGHSFHRNHDEKRRVGRALKPGEAGRSRNWNLGIHMVERSGLVC
jgi:hypothetical protein